VLCLRLSMHTKGMHRMTTVLRSIQSRALSAVRAVTIFGAIGVLMASCTKSKPTTGCAPEIWSGQCVLVSLAKVEDRELPVPHVVYEARYRPQKNTYSPNYTPPEV